MPRKGFNVLTIKSTINKKLVAIAKFETKLAKKTISVKKIAESFLDDGIKKWMAKHNG